VLHCSGAVTIKPIVMLRCVNVALALSSLNKKGGDVEEAVIILVPCIICITQKALKVTVKKIFVMQLTQIEQMFLRQ